MLSPNFGGPEHAAPRPRDRVEHPEGDGYDVLGGRAYLDPHGVQGGEDEDPAAAEELPDADGVAAVPARGGQPRDHAPRHLLGVAGPREVDGVVPVESGQVVLERLEYETRDRLSSWTAGAGDEALRHYHDETLAVHDVGRAQHPPRHAHQELRGHGQEDHVLARGDGGRVRARHDAPGKPHAGEEAIVAPFLEYPRGHLRLVAPDGDLMAAFGQGLGERGAPGPRADHGYSLGHGDLPSSSIRRANTARPSRQKAGFSMSNPAFAVTSTAVALPVSSRMAR